MCAMAGKIRAWEVLMLKNLLLATWCGVALLGSAGAQGNTGFSALAQPDPAIKVYSFKAAPYFGLPQADEQLHVLVYRLKGQGLHASADTRCLTMRSYAFAPETSAAVPRRTGYTTCQPIMSFKTKLADGVFVR